jgi:uncharacterized membrane protein HdeD (DUF308 family)
MTPEKIEPARIQAAVARTLHAHWRLFLIEGAVLLFLGLLAIIVPSFATVAVELLLGWLLLISGVVGLITTLRMRSAPGVGWAMVSAFLGIAVGLILLWWPLSGAITMTLILTVFFVIEGIASILYALDHRRELSGRWGWMLSSGVIDLILAGLIFFGLPGTAAWAIGLLVGINMIFGGSALIGMALRARSAAPPL